MKVSKQLATPPSQSLSRISSEDFPGLNRSAVQFLIQFQKRLGSLKRRSEASWAFEDSVSKFPGNDNSIAKPLNCKQLQGPRLLMQVGINLVGEAFSDAPTIKDQGASAQAWKNFAAICPQELTYGEAFLGAVSKIAVPMAIEMRAAELQQKASIEQARKSQIAHDDEQNRIKAQKEKDTRQQEARAAEARSKDEDQRALDLKSGKANVASFKDALLLKEPRQCVMLIIDPTEAARTNLCVVFGRISRVFGNGDGLMVDFDARHYYVVDLPQQAVFFGARRSDLRPMQLIQFIGTYEGSIEPGGPPRLAYFKALYVR